MRSQYLERRPRWTHWRLSASSTVRSTENKPPGTVYRIHPASAVLSPCDEYRYASEPGRLKISAGLLVLGGAGLEQPAYRDFLSPRFVGRVCGVLSSPT